MEFTFFVCLFFVILLISPTKNDICLYFVIDDVSISGFKEGLSEQNSTEGASVILAQEADEAQSPDAISAASQSIDEPMKDLVINSAFLFHF